MHVMHRKSLVTGAGLLLVAAGGLYLLIPGRTPPTGRRDPVATVSALIETTPVPSPGDAADDPAVWVHPDNPADSLVIGTDKDGGGLGVYDMAGRQLQYVRHGRPNNVDVRNGFTLGPESVSLVTAGDRTDNSILIYKIDEDTRTLEDVAARRITTVPAYGSCMYRSRRTGRLYYFVNSVDGEVEQWELFGVQGGKVDGRRVRSFSVNTRPEGCVADDELGHVYIGLEDEGVLKFEAEPTSPARGEVVDRTMDGHLDPEVEGLALYETGPGTGYLVASNQAHDSFVVYRREDGNDYLGTFAVVEGNGIDGVTHTDGIAIQSGNLGPLFPRGVFVAQDNENDTGNQNFKLVPWHAIETALRATGGQADAPGDAQPAAD